MPSENINNPIESANKFKVGSEVFYNGHKCLIKEKHSPGRGETTYGLRIIGESEINPLIKVTEEELVSTQDKEGRHDSFVEKLMDEKFDEPIEDIAKKERAEKIKKLRAEEAELEKQITELRIQILALPYKDYDIKGEIDRRRGTTEKKEVKSFSIVYIEESIRKLLKGEVKSIDKLKVREAGNEIILDAEITVSKFFITAKISLGNARLANKGDSIALKDGYKLSATKAEDKVKDMFSKHINSIGEKIKEYIENEESKKVEKISIENGQLMVTFGK